MIRDPNLNTYLRNSPKLNTYLEGSTDIYSYQVSPLGIPKRKCSRKDAA